MSLFLILWYKKGAAFRIQQEREIFSKQQDVAQELVFIPVDAWNVKSKGRRIQCSIKDSPVEKSSGEDEKAAVVTSRHLSGFHFYSQDCG